ncbi:type-F conjugative transfer system secretin TraK [Sphingomonas oryzagri]
MSMNLSCLLAGTGAVAASRAPVSFLDRQVRIFGFGILGAVCFLLSSPASADQFKMAADNAHVDCTVSKSDITRISLVGDQIASVSKRMAGGPYNDFSIVNEPIRGDIYVAIPDAYASASISFFATSKKGYVYQFTCGVAGVAAQQVFVTNPGIATSKASDWEGQTPVQDTAVRLIQAMSTQQTIDGYAISQPSGSIAKVGDLAIRLISEYRGAALQGKVLRIENHGVRPASLSEADLAPQGTLAVTITQPNLGPGQATTAYLVGQNGGQ